MALLAAGGIGLGQILGIGGSLLGAVGSIQQASAAQSAANYNAQVNENNAIVAMNQGAAKATEVAQRTRQKVAAVAAGSAENGMNMSGSAQDVVDSVSKAGTLDGLTAMWDSTTRAVGYHNSAELDRMQGRAAGAAGGINAMTSIFDGFSRVFS